MPSPCSGFSQALVGGRSAVPPGGVPQAAQMVLASSCPSSPGTPRLRGGGHAPGDTARSRGHLDRTGCVCPRARGLLQDP